MARCETSDMSNSLMCCLRILLCLRHCGTNHTCQHDGYTRLLCNLCALLLTASLCGQVTDQYNERWRSDWITSDFWHVLNFIFLCVIAFLWRPSAHATRFAYSALDGMCFSTCSLVKLFGLTMLHFSDRICSMSKDCCDIHAAWLELVNVVASRQLAWLWCMLTCILHLVAAVVAASYHTQLHLVEVQLLYTDEDPSAAENGKVASNGHRSPRKKPAKVSGNGFVDASPEEAAKQN